MDLVTQEGVNMNEVTAQEPITLEVIKNKRYTSEQQLLSDIVMLPKLTDVITVLSNLNFKTPAIRQKVKIWCKNMLSDEDITEDQYIDITVGKVGTIARLHHDVRNEFARISTEYVELRKLLGFERNKIAEICELSPGVIKAIEEGLPVTQINFRIYESVLLSLKYQHEQSMASVKQMAEEDSDDSVALPTLAIVPDAPELEFIEDSEDNGRIEEDDSELSVVPGNLPEPIE